MRFKPRRNRQQGPSDTQTLTSDRESLPFPEGGVFSAKPAPTTNNAGGMSAKRPRKNGAAIAEDLDSLFENIRTDLDKLGDLLDEPFRLPSAINDNDGGPRRAA